MLSLGAATPVSAHRTLRGAVLCPALAICQEAGILPAALADLGTAEH